MTDPFRRLSTAQQRAQCEEWAKEHGEAFYRSVYPGGIPRELLESFGIWTVAADNKKRENKNERN